MVSQNARTIGKALRLNEDLVEAIALGHDLGHTPFGHAGERTLNDLCSQGFVHSDQSVRIVEKLEKDGHGLNLTWEVRDGIRNHQTETMPATPEGQVVRLSDKIAYINHDIDDAIRGHILTDEDIPLALRNVLGHTTRERLDTLIHDVVSTSLHNISLRQVECRNDLPIVAMSAEVHEAMFELRGFMYEHVYKNPTAKLEEAKAQRMIAQLFEYYSENLSVLPPKYRRMLEAGEAAEVVVCDYIAGMTDQYAIQKFEELFMPMSWQVEGI